MGPPGPPGPPGMVSEVSEKLYCLRSTLSFRASLPSFKLKKVLKESQELANKVHRDPPDHKVMMALTDSQVNRVVQEHQAKTENQVFKVLEDHQAQLVKLSKSAVYPALLVYQVRLVVFV